MGSAGQVGGVVITETDGVICLVGLHTETPSGAAPVLLGRWPSHRDRKRPVCDGCHVEIRNSNFQNSRLPNRRNGVGAHAAPETWDLRLEKRIETQTQKSPAPD